MAGEFRGLSITLYESGLQYKSRWEQAYQVYNVPSAGETPPVTLTRTLVKRVNKLQNGEKQRWS